MADQGEAGPVVPDEEQDRFRYRLTAHSTAAREVLWPLLAEVERWKDWSFLTRSYLLEPGRPEPNGVGALRRLAVGPFGSCEEVVAFEPPRHLGYVARKGMPARDYRASVTLEDLDGGTQLTWEGRLQPIVPGTGVLVLAYARGFVSRFLRDVVRYAEGSGSGSGSGSS